MDSTPPPLDLSVSKEFDSYFFPLRNKELSILYQIFLSLFDEYRYKNRKVVITGKPYLYKTETVKYFEHIFKQYSKKKSISSDMQYIDGANLDIWDFHLTNNLSFKCLNPEFQLILILDHLERVPGDKINEMFKVTANPQISLIAITNNLNHLLHNINPKIANHMKKNIVRFEPFKDFQMKNFLHKYIIKHNIKIESENIFEKIIESSNGSIKLALFKLERAKMLANDMQLNSISNSCVNYVIKFPSNFKICEWRPSSLLPEDISIF